jgi:hypothetical protein
MNFFRVLGLASFTSVALSLGFGQAAQAELLTLGEAAGGQVVRLDTASITRNGNSGSWWGGFTYYLGGERINAEVHCGQGTWYVDGRSYTPQSRTTETMIRLVCSARQVTDEARGPDMAYMLVFDPPSNVRSSPGGSVICMIDQMEIIRVYVEPRDGWFLTTACGSSGWIHESQIRVFR